MASNRPRVCFVALSAYNLLARDPSVQRIGGAEAQQCLLARGLLSRGYRVSFVLHDHGQQDGQLMDGIQVFNAYASSDGLPGLRFVHPRMTRLWSAMSRADADIYYQRGAEAETGIVAAWCRWHRRQFTFALAGHHMLLPHGDTRQPWRERRLAWYGMARANLLLVQTQEQKSLLQDRFRLGSEVLHNCALVGESTGKESGRTQRDGVIWVGRIHPIKRLEWCLETAQLLPDVAFTIIGSAGHENQYTAQLRARINAAPNVRWLGYVPPDRVREYYQGAKLLLCTSVSEGFPNTFLEAFSAGTPVVSTVDPDEIVRRRGLGRYAVDPPALAEAVSLLLRDGTAWQRCSETCRKYQQEHHSPEVIVDRFERLLQPLWERGAGTGACSVSATGRPV